MKKGSLNFLGRKNQSLFDTKIKIIPQEIDDKPLELMLDASAIPESGTAKVRARPTVKHFLSSSDIVQGFAVPTPTVPPLPPPNGPRFNGAVNGDRLSNGSAMSVPDLVEGEILIPPPPSVAPPPPPPHFLGDLDVPDLASLQPPPMAPPEPPSLAPSDQEEDLASLRPPPMAPPKPPSTSSSASTSSIPISTPSSVFVPDISECPQFIPPQPPQRIQKTPPPKPTRLSSISILDGPPLSPAPSPLPPTSTPSSFNPQNTAKLYSIPKSSILGAKVDREKRPQQILLLEDSESGDSVAVPVQVDGNAKPALRNSSGPEIEKEHQDLQRNLQSSLPVRPATPQTKEETVLIAAQQEVNRPSPTPSQGSPNLQRASPVAPVTNQTKLEESPGRTRKYSPLLDRKLRHLKAGEVSVAREGVAASPLALLMAAKEREKKHRSLSRENSTRSEKESTASIQPSESSPNSFTVIPRCSSTSSLPSRERPQERPRSVVPIEPVVRIQTLEAAQIVEETFPPMPARDEENGEDLCMPLLPPPPEFANFDDDVEESPPSSPAPDPPSMTPPPPPVPAASPVPPVKTPVPPPIKPKPPSPPKLPPPVVDARPKLQIQTRPRPPPATPSAHSLTASQATLLSILQKKMLEMDSRMSVPRRESEAAGSDDWGSPLSDEESAVPVPPRAAAASAALPLLTLKTKSSAPPPAPTQGLDIRELENKIAKKALDSPSKVTAGDGQPSKHPHGMTFIVRPGTKQPITLISKGESS